MSKLLSKLGASAFLLWGLLHVAGAGMIFSVGIDGGLSAGYSIYGYVGPDMPPIAGAILGYFTYFIGLIGAVVSVVAIKLNWRNSQLGLALNTGIAGITELGLVGFLVVPGHVAVTEALPGLSLLVLGIMVGGIACQNAHTAARKFSGPMDMRAQLSSLEQ
jgi:hypothetical protein